MNPRALIAEPDDFSPRAVELLRRGGVDVDLSPVTPGDLSSSFSTHDVVWLRLAHRIDAGVLGDKPRCRVLATPVTGLDHIDLAACEQRGIRVVSLKGEVEFLRRVRATAELTMGLMLSLLRHIPASAEDVKAGRWDRDSFRGQELFEKTVGVVGMGRLGSIVAGYLRAFGCHVLGADPRSDFPPDLVERVSLDELLARSDVVTLHVSYSPSTRHLIDAAALARMKRGAILVNTSRGGIVDEGALLAALESGYLGGAALDVLDGEPAIDESHPLVEAARRLKNLLVVPHIGGNTAESFEKTEVFLAGRVLDALREAK